MPVLIPLPLKRLTGMLAKVEVTYGVDPTPVVGTDGVRLVGNFFNVIRPSYAWPNLRTDAATGTIFPVTAGVPHGSEAELDIAVEVKGSGVAYSSSVKPEDDPLSQACGWSSVFSGGAGSEIVTNSLLASGHKSCTIYGYGGGQRFIVTGCRGTMNQVYQAGDVIIRRYRMRGFLSSITATAQPTITSYDTTTPIVSVNAGLSIGTYDPTWNTAEFVQGCTVQRFDSGSATDGIAFFDWLRPDDGFPALDITVVGPDDGTGKWDTTNFNPWGDATARTSRALDATVGSVQYNRQVLTIASTYTNMPDHSDVNEAAAVRVHYTITDSAMTFVWS